MEGVIGQYIFVITIFALAFYFIDILVWGSWFSVIGFLHIHAQLCQDRFEYVGFITKKNNIYNIILDTCIFLFCS